MKKLRNTFAAKRKNSILMLCLDCDISDSDVDILLDNASQLIFCLWEGGEGGVVDEGGPITITITCETLYWLSQLQKFHFLHHNHNRWWRFFKWFGKRRQCCISPLRVKFRWNLLPSIYIYPHHKKYKTFFHSVIHFHIGCCLQSILPYSQRLEMFNWLQYSSRKCSVTIQKLWNWSKVAKPIPV